MLHAPVLISITPGHGLIGSMDHPFSSETTDQDHDLPPEIDGWRSIIAFVIVMPQNGVGNRWHHKPPQGLQSPSLVGRSYLRNAHTHDSLQALDDPAVQRCSGLRPDPPAARESQHALTRLSLKLERSVLLG